MSIILLTYIDQQIDMINTAELLSLLSIIYTYGENEKIFFLLLHALYILDYIIYFIWTSFTL